MKKMYQDLAFVMYYLLCKRCYDPCIIYMLTKEAESLIVILDLSAVVGRHTMLEQTTSPTLTFIAQKSIV